MASPANPNIALNNAAADGDAAPGLPPLEPPAGAYFGRYMPPPFSNSTTFNSPVANFPIPHQDIVQQSINEFFVYWINGTPPNPGPGIPGSYLIILRQSFITSVSALLFSNGAFAGWMLYHVHTGTRLSEPASSSLTLLAASPNTGDQYASVKQGIAPTVATPGGRGTRYIEVTDQAPLRLPGWAVQNKQFCDWDTNGHDMNTAYWDFRQTTPWDPQAKDINDTDSTGTAPWATFFINDIVAPIPDISRSSLSATTYATWMITNSTWTQDKPPSCQVHGRTTMNGDAYFLMAAGYYDGSSGYPWPPQQPWVETSTLNAGGGPFSLQLDQIVHLT
jgi:hypothetical protein